MNFNIIWKKSSSIFYWVLSYSVKADPNQIGTASKLGTIFIDPIFQREENIL